MDNQLPNWAMLLGNYGFPIVITGYLLLRFEKRIEILSNAIKELRESIISKNERGN